MIQEKVHKADFIHDLNAALTLLRCLDYKLRNFIVPIGVGLIGTVFDAAGKLLLIPVLNGLITRDYGFVIKLPVIGSISARILQGVPQKDHNVGLFVILMGIVFVTVTLQYLFMYWELIISSDQTRALTSLTQKAIFNRHLSFGKKFYDREVPSQVNNVILNFPELIFNKIQHSSLILVNGFRFFLYFVILCVLSWKLTIVAVIIFPTLFFLSRWLNRKIRATSQEIVVVLKDFSKQAADAIANITLVKLYRNERAESEKFSGFSGRVASLLFSNDKKVNLLGPLQEYLLILAILVFVSFMTHMVMQDKGESVASFFVYFYLLRTCGTNFYSLSAFWTSWTEISGMCHLVLDVFSDTDKEFTVQGKEEFPDLQEQIQYKGLSYSYDERTPVLNKLDLTIKKGEIVAVVGTTGSGKSTLMHLLLRYYNFTSGSILVDGKDIRDFSLDSYYPHFSFVGQNVSLFNDTLRNNLIYGLSSVPEEALHSVLKKARLEEMVAQLPKGLDTEIGDQGVCLSGGERQRLAIARALLKPYSIFLLDEATSALDSETERMVNEAIQEAIKGKTAIIIAHRLSTIKNANKIIVMEKGQVTESGTLNELLDKKGRFYQYCEEQKIFKSENWVC